MNRLQKTFGMLRRAAFIGYLVAGNPSPADSTAIARRMLESGLDILEIGIPFSDPVADGPMLQKANSRALASGATPETAFALARNLRTVSETPMVLLTYANIVYRRGIDRFYADAHAAGIDGVLIVDVPVEEAEPYLAAARREEINQIFLIAPTTSTARIIHTASVTGGYIYIVSVPGVTGARSELSGEVIQVLHTVRRYSPLPLAVGFGISSPTQVRTLCAAGADGIIIGSAFADIIERYAHDPAKMLQEVQDFAGTIRDAIPDAAAAETEERP